MPRRAYALAALAALLATSAQAQQPVCAPDAKSLAAQLRNTYREVPTAMGVDAKGNLVTVFASESGTFTIAVTKPGGPTCIVSAGESWVAEKPVGAPKPGRVS